MKILLVNPPYSRLKGAGQAPWFPLGLGCLAQALTDRGPQIRILNCENPASGEKIFPIDKETVYRQRSQSYAHLQQSLRDVSHPAWSEFQRVLEEFQPDLVGITVMTVSAGAAALLSTLVKKWACSVPVVWGGVHPTFETEACLDEPGVDIVVRGEGERTFSMIVELLEAGRRSWDEVPGLSYRDEHGHIHHTGDPVLIENLDDVFPPRRDLDFFPERYRPLSWGSIMASRGCPWQCSFCSSPAFWRRRLRYRDPKKVVEEIAAVVQGGYTRHFTFWDDSFTANVKKIEELCRAIIEVGLKITWKTATRIDLIDDDVLTLMRQAGCVQLQIGIETGSRRMATIVTKDVDPFLSIEAVRRIQSHGIGAGAFFMAGFPSETEEDLHETFSLMKQLGADEMVLNIFDPMPGSAFFEELRQKEGLLPRQIDWKDFPLWPDRHFATEIEPGQFETLVETMADWLFRYNNRFVNKWRKNKPELLFLIRHDRPFLRQKMVLYTKALLMHPRSQRRLMQHSGRRAVLILKWLFWRIGPGLFSRLPLSMVWRLADVLGDLLFYLDKRRRTLISEEMRLLLGASPTAALLDAEAKVSFRNFVKEQLETFQYRRVRGENVSSILQVSGIDHVRTSQQKGRGTIILTAHFGAHLLPILALDAEGYNVFQLGTPPSAWEEMVGMKTNSLEKDIFHRRNSHETTLPATFVFLNSSMRDVYRVLEQNGVLIVAFDGRAGSRWKKVPFLERVIQVSPGPFHLAHSSGAAIIPSFVVREDSGRNTVLFHPPLPLHPDCNREEETERALDEFLTLFGEYITRNPGHYGWLLQAARIRATLDPYPLFIEDTSGGTPGPSQASCP